jgi:hypothetical protein
VFVLHLVLNLRWVFFFLLRRFHVPNTRPTIVLSLHEAFSLPSAAAACDDESDSAKTVGDDCTVEKKKRRSTIIFVWHHRHAGSSSSSSPPMTIMDGGCFLCSLASAASATITATAGVFFLPAACKSKKKQKCVNLHSRLADMREQSLPSSLAKMP